MIELTFWNGVALLGAGWIVGWFMAWVAGAFKSL